MIPKSTRIGAAVCLLALALALTSCAKKPAEVVSTWPVADSEREVAAPPVPVLWPYTGLVAPDKGAIKKRPFCIKIENLPAARPQTGLNAADVVYETVVEGGITRFHLVYQSMIPKIVGPVRSARLSDLWLVPQYHGVFFFSGASGLVMPRVRRSGMEELSQATSAYAYYRNSSRPAPHNLYMSMSKAWADIVRHKFQTKVTLPALEFGPPSAIASAAPVKSVYVPLSGFNNVTWTYDKKREVFLRQNNHAVHRDAATGKQVAAKNVVVLWAKYSPAGIDKHGGMTWDVNLGGSGRATVFRNGRRFNAKWIATRTTPPHFVDTKGRPIRLAPGNTWFEVVNLDVNISMK